jgi:hypothetical protein
LCDAVWFFAQGAEYAAAEAAVVAAENARAAPVFISGATCKHATFINGFFEPTQEKGLDGRVRYAKKTTVVIRIEHYAGRWKIMPAAFNRGDFVSQVEGGCGLDACTSPWMVFDGEDWDFSPDVKLVTGAEAERQVRGRCMRARQSSSPTATPPPFCFV